MRRSGRRMTVRWQTVIPLSSALITLIITYNTVAQLPTDSVTDIDQDVTRERAGRSKQVSKLFPDDDDDDDFENKHDGKRKRTAVERREKALLLFDDEDDQDAKMMVPSADEPPLDDDRDARQENAENARQQQQEELVDKNVENNNAEVIEQRDYSKDTNDDGGSQLLMNNVGRNVPDQAQSDVDDHNHRVESRNSRSDVNNRRLLKNVRAVGAIVQGIKRRGVAGVEDSQELASVNPHPFRYVINCPQLCSDVEHLFLIVYVHTTIGHYKRRTVIRQTWGDVSQYDVNIRIVFVMGVHAGAQDTQTALAFEAERYEDIVQVIHSNAELIRFCAVVIVLLVCLDNSTLLTPVM